MTLFLIYHTIYTPTALGKMVDGTRRGRVAKGKSEGWAGKVKGTKSQGVTKPKSKAAQRKDAQAPRGKERKAAAAVTVVADQEAVDAAELQIKEAASAATSQEPLVPASKPKVSRVYNEIWASTLASIAFISETTISTTKDTNIITLNLIDHIIKPENWNPNLSYNVLSATCFFFAPKITGEKRNTPDRIASAMKVDVHLIEAMAGPQVHYNSVVRVRLAEALRVRPEDVVKGYGILFEQREGLREFVGEYVKELKALPEPSELGRVEVHQFVPETGWDPNVAEDAEQAERNVSEEVLPSDEAAIEAEKASEVELDPSELDDFDRYVGENE